MLRFKIINRLLLLLTFLSCTTIGWSQRSFGGFPLPDNFWNDNSNGSLRSSSPTNTTSDNDWVVMPPFDIEMVRKDSLQLRVGGMQFAHPFPTELTPQNSGETRYTTNGDKVWRLKIRSVGASSINLIFNKFHLSGNSKVFLYSPDKSTIYGAYTKENNRKDKVFATSPIPGDEIVVEYFESRDSHGEIEIGQVNHGFRNWQDLMQEETTTSYSKEQGELRAFPTFGSAAECQVNVNENDPIQKRSVVVIMINGTNACTGALINNTSNDGTPYLLSAAHCLIPETGVQKTASQLASTCVFYFNYESPHNYENIQGSLEMSLSGATISAMRSEGDMLLLKLDEMPPLEYGAFFSGWDLSETVADCSSPTEEKHPSVFCIHHPRGDVKKICYGLSAPVASSFKGDDLNFTSNSHWILNGWQSYRLTEPGSSGAPLFNCEGRIIGALSGGYDPNQCGLKNRDAFYRLNVSWLGRNATKCLSTWLDPKGGGETLRLEGLEPYHQAVTRLSNHTDGEHLVKSTEPNYVAGTNSLGYAEYAERFSSASGKLFGAYVILERGTYSPFDTVWVKVYNGNDTPDKLLYQQQVRITDTQFTKEQFETLPTNLLYGRDNYIRFDSPVEIGPSFFISIEFPMGNALPYGIYRRSELTDEPFAFFLDNSSSTSTSSSNGVWKSFAEHPLVNHNTSLAIDPLILLQKNMRVEELKTEETLTTLFPNPTQGTITLQCAERPSSIDLIGMNGMILNTLPLTSPVNTHSSDYKHVTSWDISSFPTGIYILYVKYQDKVEQLKIIKE